MHGRIVCEGECVDGEWVRVRVSVSVCEGECVDGECV